MSRSSVERALSVLVIDDDLDFCKLLECSFQANGFTVDIASDRAQAEKKMLEAPYDAVLIDVFLGHDCGLESLREIIRKFPKSRLFTITGKDTVSLAVEAMQYGATSFFPKSIGANKMAELVKTKLGFSGPEVSVAIKDFEDLNLFGRSSAILKVCSQIQKFCKVDSTVLISGESGTGKEVVARALHHMSDRKSERFEAINCAAIPENLLESELFGHTKGAFTDANSDKKGLFEVCSNGTLVLDEIGDMPKSLQVKILRVLQEREVRPLGSTKTIKVNPRIIACTHRNLTEMVESGDFRKDLYFRISVLQMHVPPLRQRPEDIPELTCHFVDQFSRQFGKRVAHPNQEILSRLEAYNWPGNIRELKNTIERGVVLSRDGFLHYNDIFFSEEVVNGSVPAKHDLDVDLPLEHREAKLLFERKYVVQLLTQAQGNISKAAQLSGKHRVEIYRLMEKHGLRREDFLKEK